MPTRLRCKKVTILDYSSEDVVDASFLRVSVVPEGQTYDFIQLCHVLEHVSEPHLLMKQVMPHLSRGGYVYIEVPQDRSDEDLHQFTMNSERIDHTIHEHLNLYSPTSLHALAKSIGLKAVHLQAVSADLGWTKATIVAGLFEHASA